MLNTSPMNTFDLLLKNGSVLLENPNGGEAHLQTADIGVLNGTIAAINPSQGSAKQTFDLKGLTVCPGWIDSQVHFREPGLEHKEDLRSGSAAAAQGGITAYFEMPNTKPATTNQILFEDKITRGRKTSFVDFAFYAGANGENTASLPDLEQLEGCCGVKIFMGSSTGSLLVDDLSSLDLIFKALKRRPSLHAEDEARLRARRQLVEDQPGNVHQHPIWRDEASALLATQNALRLAMKNHRSIHILHVSTAEEMELLKDYKQWASVEVTPQHLTLAAPECYDRWGTLVQMNPPIRDVRHRDALWKALKSGVVDVLGSDHAPHTFQEKQGIYPNTPSGLPGVQTMSVLMLNHVHEGRLSLFDVNRLLATNPVKLWGVRNRGYIHPGFEATFSIFDLNKQNEITSSWLKSKCGWSPFEGMKVKGWPIHTILRGEFVLQDEVLKESKGRPLQFGPGRP